MRGWCCCIDLLRYAGYDSIRLHSSRFPPTVLAGSASGFSRIQRMSSMLRGPLIVGCWLLRTALLRCVGVESGKELASPVKPLCRRSILNHPSIIAISGKIAIMERAVAVLKMTSTQFQERPGEALDRSLSQHLVVLKHGRPRNVILSYEEYDRLIRQDRRSFAVEDLSDADLEEIAGARMAPGHKTLDSELDSKRK
jgi:prevent-host-death family protein